MFDHDSRLISRPFRIKWEGWETNTEALGHHGWDISAREDPGRNIVELALRHRQMDLYGLSEAMRWHDAFRYTHDYTSDPPIFFMRAISREISIQTITTPCTVSPFAEFEPIDPNPILSTHYLSKETHIFARLTQEQEVLFDQADMTVVEHLEAIKALQAPRQLDLREKARKARIGADKIIEFPQRQVVAQLVELKEA